MIRKLRWLSGRESRLCLATAGVLVLTACGNGGGQASNAGSGQLDCSGTQAQQAKAQYNKPWATDPPKVGLKPLQPTTDTKVCVSDTTQFKKKEPYTIAFASQGPTNSWARIYDEALMNQARTKYANTIKNIDYASANGDASKQVNDIQDLLVKQPDALIVTPMGAADKGPVERAAAQKIPVILCTGELDANGYVTSVGRDNQLNGALTAQWIVDQINGKGDIIAISGIPGVPTAEERWSAAKKIFDKYPNIKVVNHAYGQWSPTKSQEVMQGLLAAHPTVAAVWSDSSFGAIGTINAYKAAGKTQMPPMTAEPLNGFLKLAKANNVNFLAVGYPPTQSTSCLDATVQALQGRSLSSRIDAEAPVFTQKDIDQYLRPNCSDDLWVPASLPENVLTALKLC